MAFRIVSGVAQAMRAEAQRTSLLSAATRFSVVSLVALASAQIAAWGSLTYDSTPSDSQ